MTCVWKANEEWRERWNQSSKTHVDQTPSRTSMGKADDKNMFLLNQLIDLWVQNGERLLRFEPDLRRVQIALYGLALDKKNVKPLSNPGVHDHEFTCQDELPEDERTKFRSIPMRLAFLAQDLPHWRQRERCRYFRSWLGNG